MSATPITFEEIMYTTIEATQEVFRAYMDIDLFSGRVEKSDASMSHEFMSLVGVASDRVGYIMFGIDRGPACTIATALTAEKDPDAAAIRDAIGELGNMIAGVFKTKYHEQFGGVKLGLPMVLSGCISPLGPQDREPDAVEAAVSRNTLLPLSTAPAINPTRTKLQIAGEPSPSTETANATDSQVTATVS
jgi:CheY-specific phosphatase CheX